MLWNYRITYLKITTTTAIKTIVVKTAGMVTMIANFDFDLHFFSSTILNEIKEVLVVVYCDP